MTELTRSGINYSHGRLPELMRLADANEAFYIWVEKVFQAELNTTQSLNEIFLQAAPDELFHAIAECYGAGEKYKPVASLVNGGGVPYTHRTACFYFFAWMVRDAPQQRLAPLIARIARAEGLKKNSERLALEIDILVELIIGYRETLNGFGWASLREVHYDRLEGSRRSLKGHLIEVVVRSALVSAIQAYFREHENYGMYSGFSVPDTQIKLGKETFDVSATLTDAHGRERLILVPVKSRETEGGGHAHIFTRDINSAIDAAKKSGDNFVIVVIVATNWAKTEQTHVADISDLSLVVTQNPNEFVDLSTDDFDRLRRFVAHVLNGKTQPKSWSEIRGLVEETESK
jgi:hypothetical protein